jgi:uncharacterized repeat protein (TIGR03837 family)
MNGLVAESRKHWDVFCKLVDNFGDIGVCWRLARDLSEHHQVSVRLWVDCPEVFFRLQPGLKKRALPITQGGIEVCEWCEPFGPMEAAEVADVVIEAFACGLPPAYVEAMAARSPKPVWIELDYLSAEDWVGECHGLGSVHPQSGLQRYFFFPGFGRNTGGLLREPGLFGERDRLRARIDARSAFLASLNLDASDDQALLVSLFSYENAAIPELLSLWASGDREVLLLVPEGRALSSVAAFFGEPALEVGDLRRSGRLTMRVLPFSDQSAYDRLLWLCDLNFVRGEDSFVRAQWAAKPFVWHIYRQDEGVHLAKLEAFLALYCKELDVASTAAVCAFWRKWNREQSISDAWPGLLAALPVLEGHARSWSDGLACQPDLASQLVHFCEKRL